MTFGELVRTLYCFDRNAAARFSYNVLKRPADDAMTLDRTEQVQLLLGDWLASFEFFAIDQVQTIVGQLTPALSPQVSQFKGREPTLEQRWPAVFVTIADFRWVSCTRRDTFWDAEQLRETQELPGRPITTVVGDLAKLIERAEQRVARCKEARHGRGGTSPAAAENGG